MATPTKPKRRAQIVAGSAKVARDAAIYIDDRLPFGRWFRPQLRKLFPSHWSFLLGELALYAFVLLILTGTFLTLFYKPNPDVAYESVVELSLEVRGGLLIRQLHHWSATVFVLAIVAHMCRVFFTGAFRKPRELTWMLGVLLFGLALFESFLGVSLPADQLAMTGLRQAQGVLLSVPLVGTYLSAFVFDGDFPGQVIPRVFVMHVLLVPGILLAVVPLHALILTWRQKHTERRSSQRESDEGANEERSDRDHEHERSDRDHEHERSDRDHEHERSDRDHEHERRATAVSERKVTGGPFFPYFAIKNAATALFTIGFIALLATFVRVNPVWEHGAYRPGAHPPSAQPFWYAGVLDGAQRLVPAWEIPIGGYVLQVGLWIPPLILLAFFAVLLVYPFLERRYTGDGGYHHLLDRPSQAPVRTSLGVAVITFFTVLWAGMWVSPAPPPMSSAPGLPEPPPAPAALLTVPQHTYEIVVAVLRVAVFVAPVLAFLVTKAVCARRTSRVRPA